MECDEIEEQEEWVWIAESSESCWILLPLKPTPNSDIESDAERTRTPKRQEKRTTDPPISILKSLG